MDAAIQSERVAVDKPRRLPRRRWGALVALVAAAGVGAWLLIGHNGGSSNTKATKAGSNTGPVALTASGLKAVALHLGQPVYWAGPEVGYKYELTQTANGNIYVRYLPSGTKAGAHGTNYLIVATYPYRKAFQTLKAVSSGTQTAVPGGIAVVDKTHPNSVHMAFQRVNYQVEVYDSSPQHALDVAVSGAVQPVR